MFTGTLVKDCSTIKVDILTAAQQVHLNLKSVHRVLACNREGLLRQSHPRTPCSPTSVLQRPCKARWLGVCCATNAWHQGHTCLLLHHGGSFQHWPRTAPSSWQVLQLIDPSLLRCCCLTDCLTPCTLETAHTAATGRYHHSASPHSIVAVAAACTEQQPHQALTRLPSCCCLYRAAAGCFPGPPAAQLRWQVGS